MTDSKLIIQVESTGSARVAGEIGKVTQAVKQNTAAVSEQAQKAKVAGVEIDKFGSTLGIAGQAVGRLNQTAGSMVTTLGAATGAIQSLTTAGLGPLGIAVAAANIAVAAYVELTKKSADEMARAERESQSLAFRINELAAAYQNASAEARKLRSISAGGGTREEQLAAEQVAMEQAETAEGGVSQARGRIAQLLARQARIESGDGRGGMSPSEIARELANAREELAAAQQRVAEARGRAATARGFVEQMESESLESLSISDTTAAGAGGGAGSRELQRRRGGSGGARGNRFGADPESVAANAIRAKREASDEMLRAEAERDAELERTKTQQTIEAQKARDALIYEERMAAEQKITDLLAEQEAERARIAQEADASRVASFQQTASMVQAIGSSLQQVYGFVDDASAKSDMSAEERQKRELKRMAFVQSVEAIINAANAAAAYARLDIPAGVSYTVASALNAAAAAKAGIDAGNVRASAGGGAAGGAMRRDSQARSMSSEPSTVVVNMNGPVIAATDRAELGRQLGRIVDEGRARYGS